MNGKDRLPYDRISLGVSLILAVLILYFILLDRSYAQDSQSDSLANPAAQFSETFESLDLIPATNELIFSEPDTQTIEELTIEEPIGELHHLHL